MTVNILLVVMCAAVAFGVAKTTASLTPPQTMVFIHKSLCALVILPSQFQRVPQIDVVYENDLRSRYAGVSPGWWVLASGLECE